MKQAQPCHRHDCYALNVNACFSPSLPGQTAGRAAAHDSPEGERVSRPDLRPVRAFIAFEGCTGNRLFFKEHVSLWEILLSALRHTDDLDLDGKSSAALLQ